MAQTARKRIEDLDDTAQLLNKYLKSMGAIPLLSHKDEVEVARRIRTVEIDRGGSDLVIDRQRGDPGLEPTSRAEQVTRGGLCR